MFFVTRNRKDRPVPTQQRTAPAARQALVEPLEGRQLLSATLAEGLLAVVGTHRADQIVIAVDAADAAKLNVTVNGTTSAFALADVASIVVDAGRGNDRVLLDEAHGLITASAVLNGGAGNDTLAGASGNDLLMGGAGKDNLDGRAGNDYASGGAGNDAVRGGAGKDFLRGDAGADKLDGEDGDDDLSGGSGKDRVTGGGGTDVFYGLDKAKERADFGLDTAAEASALRSAEALEFAQAFLGEHLPSLSELARRPEVPALPELPSLPDVPPALPVPNPEQPVVEPTLPDNAVQPTIPVGPPQA